MRYREFFEARRNPEQNPKVSLNQALADRLFNTPDSIDRTPNLFVSFTSIDKLGINPQSKYDTPLGIYAYPADYVSNRIKDEYKASRLPFAGDSEYANLFKVRGNIIDVSTMPYELVRHFYKQTAEFAAEQMKSVRNATWKMIVDKVESFINNADTHSRFPDYPGGQFWYVTMQTAKLIADNVKGRRAPVVWNQLFRALGIDGAIDWQGVGIIHTSEPTQAVFFNPKVIYDNQRVYNKYSPEHMDTQRARGEKKHNQQTELKRRLPSIENTRQLYNLLATVGEALLNKVPPGPLRTEYLVTYPYAIGYMKRLTDEEQYAVLKSDLANVKEIKPVLLNQKILAQVINEAEQLPMFLGHWIKNPSLEVQLAIARKDPAQLPDDPDVRAVEAALGTGLPVTDMLIQLAKKHDLSIQGYYSERLKKDHSAISSMMDRSLVQASKLKDFRADIERVKGEGDERALNHMIQLYNNDLSEYRVELFKIAKDVNRFVEVMNGDRMPMGTYLKFRPETIATFRQTVDTVGKYVESSIDMVDSMYLMRTNP